ncbi:hypothetical protein FQN60_005514 [Etheostoma spectabile]|uniref:Metalloproteinase inhibitor 3 n=1 Tax=Etheostoma spectabile TaxID=54343 RepID=A0A5J5CHL1_9PERO|nr:hypothetical protein FQN60_005514 [Etheostoma spectabile]
MRRNGLGRQREQGTPTQNPFQESNRSGTKDSLPTSNPACGLRRTLPDNTKVLMEKWRRWLVVSCGGQTTCSVITTSKGIERGRHNTEQIMESGFDSVDKVVPPFTIIENVTAHQSIDPTKLPPKKLEKDPSSNHKIPNPEDFHYPSSSQHRAAEHGSSCLSHLTGMACGLCNRARISLCSDNAAPLRSMNTVRKERKGRWKVGVHAAPARYMYGCAPLRDQGETLKRGEKQQQPEQRLGHYTPPSLLLQRTQPDSIHTLFQQHRGVEKFGEMQSVYRHLISLLFVFSSLQVIQLTEGCSCALTHPQDAFCNSDIDNTCTSACVPQAQLKHAWDERANLYMLAPRTRPWLPLLSQSLPLLKMYKGFDKVQHVQHIYTDASESLCGVKFDINKYQFLITGRHGAPVSGVGRVYDGKVYTGLCNFNERWERLSLAQKKGINHRYQLGCNCRVSGNQQPPPSKVKKDEGRRGGRRNKRRRS